MATERQVSVGQPTLAESATCSECAWIGRPGIEAQFAIRHTAHTGHDVMIMRATLQVASLMPEPTKADK